MSIPAIQSPINHQTQKLLPVIAMATMDHEPRVRSPPRVTADPPPVPHGFPVWVPRAFFALFDDGLVLGKGHLLGSLRQGR